MDGDHKSSLLHAMLGASLDGILLVDPASEKVLECNQRFVELMGIPSEITAEKNFKSVLGLLLNELLNPEEMLKILENRNQTAKNPKPVVVELKNGGLLEVHSELLSLDTQKSAHLLIFRELIDRGKLQKSLKHQRDETQKKLSFLEKILSSLPSLISYVSRDYKYLYLNSSYEKWWKISRNDFIGKPVKDLVGEKQFQAYKPYLDSALNGQALNFKVDVPFEGVGLKSTEINYVPHVAEDGHVEGVFVIIHDISDLRKTARELVMQKELLRQIIENIPTALVLKDAKDDFKITLANKAAEEIFKIPREKAVGQKYFDIRPKHFAERYMSVDQTVAKEGQVVYLPETLSQTMDGQELFLQIVKVPILAPDSSEVRYVLSLYTDITKEREARRALHQAAKMSSLGEMASGLAHEINNPLTIIHLVADSMREKVIKGHVRPAELLEPISKIEKTSERISKIVRSFRSFSRNSESDPMQIVNFNQVFEDTLELCKERFKSDGIEIRTEIKGEIRLECRAPQISQVLLNLLSNAYDAILPLPEKWIEVRAASDGKALTLTVTDSGTGIPKEFQDKIMQPFFTTKEVGKGTGLGLSISKGIVEDHQGRLYLDSKSPRTRFVLELPLRQKTKSHAPSKELEN